MTVLLTRPYEDSVRMAERLTGIETLIWPLMQIAPVGGAVVVPAGVEAMLITSAHALRRVGEKAFPRNLPVFCVGPRTAEIANDAGFETVHSAEGTAVDLAGLAQKSGLKSFFYPRAEQVSTDLKGLMAESGVWVDDVIVYRAGATSDVAAEAESALKDGRISVVTVWSARQAEILADFVARNPKWRLETTDLVAISDRAATVLEKTGFRRILVASRPDANAMIKMISAAVRQKAD